MNDEYCVVWGCSGSNGTRKLAIWRSPDLDISLDRCSKTYRLFVVVSLMAVVLLVLTTPLTRKATTPTIRRHATPSATTISTIVNPTGVCPRRSACLARTDSLER